MIKCLVIDDEPLQQDVLVDYIKECPQLELAGKLDDGADVPHFLKENPIELLFLDINMPLLNGVDLIKRLPNPPMVIFTTAYSEYAVEGFNLNAVDYLLKPISFERFKKAVEKVLERNSIASQSDALFVKVDKKNYRLEFDDIHFIEACGDYVKIHITDQCLMVHSTLKAMESKLCGKQFIRIHKSYIVSLLKIDYVEGNLISIGENKLQMSTSYKREFMQRWE